MTEEREDRPAPRGGLYFLLHVMAMSQEMSCEGRGKQVVHKEELGFGKRSIWTSGKRV